MPPPLASILVPTHNHFLTLALAVRSALNQTVRDVEVIVVGDGATLETRKAAEALAAQDGRVIFLDLPKGEHHGERHRDGAIRGARSNAIFYLCDDDLLLPKHVETLLGALKEAPFAHALGAYFTVSGELAIYPTDLSFPEAVAWHLLEPRRNCVSLTGTAHSKEAYLSLPEGWTPTPAHEWPDHYMWKKFFAQEGFFARTVQEITALQFPSSAEDRAGWPQQRRLEEIQSWYDTLDSPGIDAELRRRLAAAEKKELHEAYRRAATRDYDLADAHERLARIQGELSARQSELSRAQSDLAQTRETLAARDAEILGMKDSKFWKLRSIYMKLRGKA